MPETFFSPRSNRPPASKYMLRKEIVTERREGGGRGEEKREGRVRRGEGGRKDGREKRETLIGCFP